MFRKQKLRILKFNSSEHAGGFFKAKIRRRYAKKEERKKQQHQVPVE